MHRTFLLLMDAVMRRTLWFDRHGNWHVVFHVYKTLPFHAHEEVYSGHAFSADGIDWTFSHVEPYNGAEIKRLFGAIFTLKRSVCQDRLGTSISKR